MERYGDEVYSVALSFFSLNIDQKELSYSMHTSGSIEHFKNLFPLIEQYLITKKNFKKGMLVFSENTTNNYFSIYIKNPLYF